MRIRFSFFCHTEWGQEVFLLGSLPELGEWDTARAAKMAYMPGDVWTAEIDIPSAQDLSFQYRYAVRTGGGTRDEANARSLRLDLSGSGAPAVVDLVDRWKNPSDPDSLFLTAPYVETIFRREAEEEAPTPAVGEAPYARVRLQLVNPRVRGTDRVAITGNLRALGEWDKARAVPMSAQAFPMWTAELTLAKEDLPFSYKYVILNEKNEVAAHEDGPEHVFHMPPDGDGSEAPRFAVVTDNKFTYAMRWRGAGIAIPVFSIRTEKSLGVGEFADIKELTDWARESGFQLIQTLPINDTTAYMSWMDSYPYSCISVFALHPVYLNLEAIGGLPDGMEEEIARHRERLNKSPVMEYEGVMEIKRPFLMRLLEAQKDAFLSSPEFTAFFDEHGHWLKPYAVFSALRDHCKTGDYTQWGPYAHGRMEDIERLAAPGSEHYDTVAFYYFLHYHLHLQLLDASRYARERGVVLKGDIPIGIQKRSDTCWVRPHLFHMDESAGAPPDPFSDSGQNWGFPTYNWEEMARDNYSWWQRRLGHMSRYFQMIRLDHVLGFFRIWEIPDESFSGLMGHFNPTLPITKGELDGQGLWDVERLVEPFIPRWLVRAVFGSETGWALAHCLDEVTPGVYRLKPEVATQRDAAAFIRSQRTGSESWNTRLNAIEQGLFTLILNVLLFEDQEKRGFHPRINMQDTASFACLDAWARENLNRLYYDYFYHRQEDFWRSQAQVKLPVLKRVSNMLICGEDLGMIPDCVPGVMEEQCILGLRIQRMPREGDREFGRPWEYAYLTVCSTSSHDMSTIRGWWEEDRQRTDRFYRTILGRDGEPPATCEPGVAEEIIWQHLESPSMWAVFPIQDILAMSAELKRPGNPKDEQINIPAEAHHLWNYRLHLPVEKLREAKAFSESLLAMMRRSGRVNPY